MPVLIARLCSEQRGGVLVLFAFALIPLMIAVGASIDFVRAYNARDRMQVDLDNAMIASARYLRDSDEDAIKEKVLDWFREQTGLDSYTLDDIEISKSDYTVAAKARAAVPTTLMRLFGVDELDISVTSAASGPGVSYLNVYMLLDASASQMLAASSIGQSAMRSGIGCEFACHTGDKHVVKTVNYANNYQYASSQSLELRTDVMEDASANVIDVIDRTDPEHSRIKVGLYHLANSTTEILAPTADTVAARSRLSVTTSENGTYFDAALAAMATLAGTSGNGKTAETPLKFVIMVTDGVQSNRDWVVTSKWTCLTKRGDVCVRRPMASIAEKVAPLNPEWCSALKNQGVTVAVLYTKYLPIPMDWGYNGTLGSAMPSVWSGTLRSGVSPTITRQDYLPMALEDCASSSRLFMTADSEEEIRNGMSKLFENYLNAIHLTM